MQQYARNFAAIMLLALLVCLPVGAGAIEVRVLDRNGEPVAGVVVYVLQEDVHASTAPQSAVMDQRDTQFVPHVLVVQRGAAVSFPNSDIIAHHVYSFSKPNDFVLPLYKGTPPEPIVFEHAGIVTLGCNIHDGMLAYIAVLDTAVFGMTDNNGLVVLDVDASDSAAEVGAWSPRFRDPSQPLVEPLRPGETGVTFNLAESLRPAHNQQSESLSWDDYN